jgi:nucleoside-diphosphate-sugar epimerase
LTVPEENRIEKPHKIVSAYWQMATPDAFTGPVNEPLSSDDPQQRQPNISLAKSELGWEPVTQLLEGLLKTISYFDKMVVEGLA